MKRPDSFVLTFVLMTLAGWINRKVQLELEFEREQVRVLRKRLGKKRIRFTDGERRRLAELGKRIGRKGLENVASIVTPETILRWYRELVAEKYDGSNKRGPGRPRKRQEIRDLVVRLAKENEGWGYTRIKGALRKLGYEIGRTTIGRILLENGIDPSPQRSGKGIPWDVFLKSHFGEIAAADIFNVEVLRPWGLVRYSVVFVIDLGTRSVEIAGIYHKPYDAYMRQLGRNLADFEYGFLKDHRYLIVDRDPLFKYGFRSILESSGVRVLTLPARSPDLNAYAERFVRSIKYECLNRIVPLGERHLRKVIKEYMAHYHHERPHQGLGNELIEPLVETDGSVGEIECRERLGGLLKYYYRSAA